MEIKRKKRVAVNGYGRIGRLLVKTWYKYHANHFDLVAINAAGESGSMSVEQVEYFIHIDSNYGIFPGKLEHNENTIFIDNFPIKILGDNNPENLPWKDLKIDYVLESTGKFLTKDKAIKHIESGAKRVLITAPPKDDTKMLIMGLNHETFNPKKDFIVSMASCTTNAIGIPIYLLDKKFGVLAFTLVTTHAFTNDQVLHDSKHRKDLRRARAAGQNIIPTTTGAANSLGKIFSKFKGLSTGMSLRVPTPTVSFVCLSINLGSKVSKEQLNMYLTQKIMNPKNKKQYRNYFGVSSEPLVSKDYEGNPRSGILDLTFTDSVIINDNLSLAQIGIWYDNEWGYASKMTDLIEYISNQG